MKIGFICNEYPPAPHGGMGRVIEQLATGLVQRGHEIHIAGLYPQGAEETIAGVHILQLPLSGGPLAWLANRRRLLHTICHWSRHGVIDLLEAPLSQGLIAACPSLSVPLVLRLHGSQVLKAEAAGQTVSLPHLLVERMALKRADFCCAVSDFMVRAVAQRFHQAIAQTPVIYNPLPPLVFQLTPRLFSQRRDVVFAGTLSEGKGILTLFNAWQKVNTRFPDAALHLAGREGSTFAGERVCDWFARQAKDLQRLNIRLHGPLPHSELLQLFAATRIAVFPSFMEAFGLAAAEARACGCATIISDMGSGPELVRQREDGLLVHPRNADDLADALLLLLQDDELARRISQNGRCKAMELSDPERILPLNEAFFATCIADFRQQQGS